MRCIKIIIMLCYLLLNQKYKWVNKSISYIDIAKLNGENGSFLKNTDMDRYSQYESTARTVLRLMWFLDFVFHLYEGL